MEGAQEQARRPDQPGGEQPVEALGAAARALEPRIRLAKVSTEEAPGLSAELRITGIPTLALFAGGREVARQAGAMPAGRIVDWASQVLAAA